MQIKIGEGSLTGRSIGAIYADLTAALKNAGLWDCLDYFKISLSMKKRENSPFPHFEWLSCSPVTGENGGHYVYVGTVAKSRYSLMFVGKTLEGFQAACEVANMCADQLRA